MKAKTTKPTQKKNLPPMTTAEHAELHAAAQATGDFASGLRQQQAPAMPPASSFAEGQRDLPAETNASADFARGLRQKQSDSKTRADYARGLRHEHEEEHA
jgi:hypothetical protein